jgi:hypothetical protein
MDCPVEKNKDNLLATCTTVHDKKPRLLKRTLLWSKKFTRQYWPVMLVIVLVSIMCVIFE